jgi:hypothetical protein
MRIFTAVLSSIVLTSAAYAERPTERYAPAQLSVAHDMLERARAAAALGDTGRAGRFAWQAGLDARLAWAMTESQALRAEAAQIGAEARALVTSLAGTR